MTASSKSPRKHSEYHGVLLVDKPIGITSHDVVDRVREIFSTRRVGHTGTLDPQASGLLLLVLGEATKISEYLVGSDKSYEGTIRFGATSDTYDSEGEVTENPGAVLPTDLEEVQDAASNFTGKIRQKPPIYSARKLGGKKLYEYAREGEEPPVEPRNVTVDDFEIINLENGISEFGVDCSSGTYVRSLSHDLGQALGCGAVLTELRRTDVGPFHIEDAHGLESLEKHAVAGTLSETIVPIRLALTEYATVYLMPGAEGWLRRGQSVPHNMVKTADDRRPARGSFVLLCRINGDAVAIGRVDPVSMSPAPKSMFDGVAPWYQPIKQFDIPEPNREDSAPEA